MMSQNKVPQIRFEGFNGEWEENKIIEKCSISTGKNNTQDKNEDGKYPFYVRSPIIEHSHKYLYDEEAVLTVGDGVGTGKVYHYVNGKYNLHQRVYRIYDLKEIFGQYFYYYFSNNFYSRVMSMTAKTSVDSVRLEMIANMDISYPKLDEQTKIGNYFQQLDKLIEEKEKKYQKLKQFKKAMLDKMFPKNGANTPEIRFEDFSGEWEKRKFGECVLIQRGGSPRPIENFITNDENGINWIKIGDVSKGSRYITKTKEKIIPEGERNSRRVYKGDLILSNSMSFGRPYIMAIDGCIHDGWLLIRDEKKIFNLEYLLQLLSSDYMINQYKALASGGVVINLNSELVQSTTIYTPTLEEQTKIGNYFQTLDKQIDLQNKEIEKLKNIKKASLDKMFV